MRYGFKLIGLDIAAYSNRDIESKQVRLDFGLELDQQNTSIPMSVS